MQILEISRFCIQEISRHCIVELSWRVKQMTHKQIIVIEKLWFVSSAFTYSSTSTMQCLEISRMQNLEIFRIYMLEISRHSIVEVDE